MTHSSTATFLARITMLQEGCMFGILPRVFPSSIYSPLYNYSQPDKSQTDFTRETWKDIFSGDFKHCSSEKVYFMFSIVLLSDRITNLTLLRIKRIFLGNGSLFIRGGVALKRGGLEVSPTDVSKIFRNLIPSHLKGLN